MAEKNSCKYMVLELTKPSNCYVKRVIGPLLKKDMEALCERLKQEYIWHSVIDLDDVNKSVPEKGKFRIDLLELIVKAINAPTVENLKSVVRHLVMLRNPYSPHIIDVSDYIRQLDCPKTNEECKDCSYSSSATGIGPAVSPVAKFRGWSHAPTCECSIITARIVLRNLGRINSANSGMVLNLLMYLKTILEHAPILVVKHEEKKDEI